MKRTAGAMFAVLTAVLMSGCAGGENGDVTQTVSETSEVTTEVTTGAVSEHTEDIEDIPEEVYDEPEEEIADDTENTATETQPANENENMTELAGFNPYSQVLHVGEKDEYGGINFSADDSYGLVTMELPENISISHTVGSVYGEKAFELGGALWRAEQGFDPEDYKVDDALGRTVTVYDESFGTDGLFEYMIHSSVPDFYSDDGEYETYDYVIRRGSFMTTVSFIAEFYDRETAENVLRSVNITPCDENGNITTLTE